jgi:hypothetical protein
MPRRPTLTTRKRARELLGAGFGFGSRGWLGLGAVSLRRSRIVGRCSRELIDGNPSFVETESLQIEQVTDTKLFVADIAASQGVAGLQQSVQSVQYI